MREHQPWWLRLVARVIAKLTSRPYEDVVDDLEAWLIRTGGQP